MGLTLIVNPASGRGRGRRSFPLIAKQLEALRVDFRAVFSEGPGHAVELARGAANDGSSAVVACGGDGTFHEVLNGVGLRSLPIGIVPCGSGDDLAVNLGIPTDIEAACRNLAAGNARPVDVVECGGSLYACVGGAGFDSIVNRRANQRVRMLRGTAIYIYAVIETLLTFEPIEMSVIGEGIEFAGRVMFVVAANATSYGGGMKIAPAALLDDGLLDIVIIGQMSKLELLGVFPRVFKGGHINHPSVRHHRSPWVTISSPRRLEFFGDGEYMTDLPVTLTVRPGIARIITPMERQ